MIPPLELRSSSIKSTTTNNEMPNTKKGAIVNPTIIRYVIIKNIS